jgi:hypothetical protein
LKAYTRRKRLSKAHAGSSALAAFVCSAQWHEVRSARTATSISWWTFPGATTCSAKRLPLAERLAEITGRRLDVIPEHELNPHLRDAILKKAVDL